MKPLPAEGSLGDRRSSAAPILSTPLPPGSRPSANRKVPANPGQRVYPWLLVIATCVSGFFCYLYITKPVFYPAPTSVPPTALSLPPGPTPTLEKTAEKRPLASLAPAVAGPLSDRLPGDPASRSSISAPNSKPGSANLFEETNFQVQHVITAEAPNGIVKRLDFKVPVLYRSRDLRWTKAEVANARELLGRLADYQEKTRALKAEGAALSIAWNQLVEKSIPNVGLQADSPTLPSNQETIHPVSSPKGSEAIRIQPATK